MISIGVGQNIDTTRVGHDRYRQYRNVYNFRVISIGVGQNIDTNELDTIVIGNTVYNFRVISIGVGQNIDSNELDTIVIGNTAMFTISE